MRIRSGMTSGPADPVKQTIRFPFDGTIWVSSSASANGQHTSGSMIALIPTQDLFRKCRVGITDCNIADPVFACGSCTNGVT